MLRPEAQGPTRRMERKSAGRVSFVIAIGVVMLCLPSLGQLAANKQEFGNHATETPLPLIDSRGTIVYPGFPADVLFKFRLYSVAAQLIMWAVIGICFAQPPNACCTPRAATMRASTLPRQPERELLTIVSPTAEQLVAELAALGDFFAVETHLQDSALVGPWQSMDSIVSDPNVLQARVEQVQAALVQAAGTRPDGVEVRVAASVTQLGLTARLIAPVLAVAVLTGRVLDLELTRYVGSQSLLARFPVISG